MQPTSHSLPRRDFIKSLAVAGAAAAVTPLGVLAAEGGAQSRGIKLGYDNFAVRAMGWKAPELIDYAAKLKTDSLFISDLDAFESFEPSHLNDLKQKAADLGLQIHVGTWSICPTSRSFRDTWGTAEEHLRTAIKVAQGVGSPVIRVVLGAGNDRSTPGGIQARIADTVKVCKACRSQAIDAGVKIAMENHAGDMQAREVVQLIEDAGGKEYMGANLDAGNAVWTLEDPEASLEILGPYALTTSLRDSHVWETETGAVCQWTAMGAGQVNWTSYFDKFAKLCPGVPVHIETISGFNRGFDYLEPEFWDVWPDAKAVDFARFLAFAKKGEPREAWRAPEGRPRAEAEKEYQLAEIEESIRYCKSLGLGLQA